MEIALTLPVILLIVTVVTLAGAVNGVAGFGFALVGTMALASIIDPALAVVFMIIPIISVNISLARELSTSEIRRCGERFGPLLIAAFVGTILGMVILERLPSRPLRVGLGLITVGYVVFEVQAGSYSVLQTAKDRCFVETPGAMIGVGLIAGILFGATNVGVQLVAYLRSCRLSHGLFVGVVAMIFLGINGSRVFVAGILGLYPSIAVVSASLAAVIPAVLGVEFGKRIRHHLESSHRHRLVMAMLLIIGVRLVYDGLGLSIGL